MSVTGFSYPAERVYRRVHRRNDSSELDIFEAKQYFSGCNEVLGLYGAALSHKAMREERQEWGMPMRHTLQSQSRQIESQIINENKQKKPRSPCGRLVNFLSYLFHQAVSRKKKSKSSTQSEKDEEESSGGRRKRRSRSMSSHFRSTSTTTDSKSMRSSSSSSGYRTPPYANSTTSTNMYKDLISYSDHKQVVPLPSENNEKVSSISLKREGLNKKRSMDLTWLDEKLLKFNCGLEEKTNNLNHGFLEKDRTWVEDYSAENKSFTRFDDVDDGGESDSSSDLFELQNFDIGFY
ncbi:PREDICTED: protein BIG GRAIN 1-like E [Nelumbo nucifera]|uniref:Protein BIG GRAIN 1-like E n=2 Tax=Nelumbo nucifera TaxID=4432 RepID=A0A1U8A3A2_NELNU|nr:PREDICTED: protein BIG GRAIN 1-like E [Nelumbo nucifera]DAD35097.1 TPA_asm: hypothetical protein HUJ06_005737 [Nelumbo nucifera]